MEPPVQGAARAPAPAPAHGCAAVRERARALHQALQSAQPVAARRARGRARLHSGRRRRAARPARGRQLRQGRDLRHRPARRLGGARGVTPRPPGPGGVEGCAGEGRARRAACIQSCTIDGRPQCVQTSSQRCFADRGVRDATCLSSQCPPSLQCRFQMNPTQIGQRRGAPARGARRARRPARRPPAAGLPARAAPAAPARPPVGAPALGLGYWRSERLARS